MTAKCLCSAVKEAALDYLFPWQVRVCCPLGAEWACHTARQWCKHNSVTKDKVALTIDFSNAFNNINRAK
eukprot:6864667-Karenia_brevis.AAC.1